MFFGERLLPVFGVFTHAYDIENSNKNLSQFSPLTHTFRTYPNKHTICQDDIFILMWGSGSQTSIGNHFYCEKKRQKVFSFAFPLRGNK